jgi:hypothetical protein
MDNGEGRYSQVVPAENGAWLERDEVDLYRWIGTT